MNRNGRANVENALLNAVPVENVLGPAVPRSRYDTKHVLHAQGDSRPVVRLDLRHGDDEIREYRGTRQPQLLQRAVVRAKSYFCKLVQVEVNEPDSTLAKDRSVTALRYHEPGVSLMAWPFCNDHLFSPESTEALASGRDQNRVRVDGVTGDVINEIGFEQNRLAANVEIE